MLFSSVFWDFPWLDFYFRSRVSGVPHRLLRPLRLRAGTRMLQGQPGECHALFSENPKRRRSQRCNASRIVPLCGSSPKSNQMQRSYQSRRGTNGDDAGYADRVTFLATKGSSSRRFVSTMLALIIADQLEPIRVSAAAHLEAPFVEHACWCRSLSLNLE